MVVTVSRTMVPLPGSISSFFFDTTSRKWSSASCTCRTWICRSRRGFLSRVVAPSVQPGALLSRGVRGEEGEAALVAAPLPPPPLPLPGERMWESFSRKSSLKERARRASLPPRAFPLERSSTSVTDNKQKIEYRLSRHRRRLCVSWSFRFRFA